MTKYEVTNCDLKLKRSKILNTNAIEVVKGLELIISLQFIADNYKSKKL
jgi:hypothetical protein